MSLEFIIREKKLEAATKETYTYGDYLSWPDEERWELIDGIPHSMSPAPSRVHQEISMELARQIANHLIGKNCRVYAAPFDVRLPKGGEKDEQIETVVQPDLVVVCDESKLDERGCKGPPDLIIEILSPHTAAKDMKITTRGVCCWGPSASGNFSGFDSGFSFSSWFRMIPKRIGTGLKSDDRKNGQVIPSAQWYPLSRR